MTCWTNTALGSWSDLAKVRQDKETEIPGPFSLQELRPFHRWVKNSCRLPEFTQLLPLFIYFLCFFVSDLIHWSLICAFLKWRVKFQGLPESQWRKTGCWRVHQPYGFWPSRQGRGKVFLGLMFWNGCFLKWWYPKMDGENNVLPYWNGMIWGENPTIFGKSWQCFLCCQEFEVLVLGGRSEQTGQMSKLELGS